MRRLVRSLFVVFAGIAALHGLMAAQQNSPDPQQAAIRKVVDGFMQPFLANHHSPGAIVGISIHGKRYFFPYGQATDDGRPFTPDTLVEIGSCTKVFTTTLFALAVNRNQIASDGSAEQYMPKGFKLQPQARKVTPLELADFSSGMPDEPNNLPQRLEMRSIEHYTTDDFLKWVSNWKPQQPLPAPYLYSNAGIGLLGYLVDEATHRPWQEQLDRSIVRPLGLADTELRPSAEQMKRMARGHRPNGTDAPPWPIFAWYAAGGLRSTAVDMLRFGEANLGHKEIDGRTVPDELIAAMNKAREPIYPLPSGKAKQGMAWVTDLGDQPGLHAEVLKNGGTAGFNTVIVVNHFKDAAIFIAVNQSGATPTGIGVAIGRHLP